MPPPAGVWHVQHCAPLFFPSARLPPACPACGGPLPAAAPRELPSPFRRAADHPRAVLIRPTVGDFLAGYGGGDLHVGVTDAAGGVVAFDAAGLRRRPAAEWAQCLLVPLPGVVAARWDRALAALLAGGEWTAERYDERARNCFSFVLALVAALRLPGLEAEQLTREGFARELVLPVSRRAAKYLTLYRRAARDGWCRLQEQGGLKRTGEEQGGVESTGEE